MVNEHTPLLEGVDTGDYSNRDTSQDHHRQFCRLVGLVPSDVSGKERDRFPKAGPNTLYERARSKRRSTQLTHAFTTSLSNTLLLSQVVLGASLTALGAANADHVLVAVFGALNTVIAGLVAYLKSRGQPMRSRMFKDDLERVVDEIENSEIMWYGIANKMHGYDDIDVDDEVSVRSEVARLTRLYDRAIRNNTLNNPDAYYSGHGGNDAFANFRTHPQAALPAISAAAALAPPGPDPSAAAAATQTQEPAPAPETTPAVTAPKAADDSPLKNAKSSNSESAKSDHKTKGSTEDDKSKTEPASKESDTKASSGAALASDTTAKKDSATAATPATPAPVPATAPAPQQLPAEPPAGVPLGADVDEGPVTALTKRKDKSNGDKGSNGDKS